MGRLILRTEPGDDAGRRGRAKLPARVPRARRRALPRGLWRAARWGAIGLLAIALGAGGFAVTRPGALPGLTGALGGGALSATGMLGLTVRQILVEGRGRVPPQSVMATVGITRGEPILGVGVAEDVDRVGVAPVGREEAVELGERLGTPRRRIHGPAGARQAQRARAADA